MWDKIKAWFKHSETIVWARIQMVVGAAMVVFSSMNLTTFLDSSLTRLQKVAIFSALFLQGLITEVLRRLRMQDPSQPPTPGA